ncbi:uncharacterized protein LOC128730291 [Anopheles nili]|uniref:uncharacterized protein LOC128730291 n=1 Tax=Anopheles nili TaxID=185578 RepID=UPI00237B97D1|nr:uncharacterized protein LOC128730291 [Anopheles nili]
MSFAGNIQTFRKNCASVNFPFAGRDNFKKMQDSPHENGTEYEQSFVHYQTDSKPVLRRDQMRKSYKEKLAQILTKNVCEQQEIIHKQEEERKKLKKRLNYYLAKKTDIEPQYNLHRTDEVVTFWSYHKRQNFNHRRNNDFTKPQKDKLNTQLE